MTRGPPGPGGRSASDSHTVAFPGLLSASTTNRARTGVDAYKERLEIDRRRVARTPRTGFEDILKVQAQVPGHTRPRSRSSRGGAV